jgi:hypothetical protein
MKFTTTFLLSAIAALAAADVSVFSERACKGTRSVVATEMGKCFNVDSGSAKGCAFPYRLRLHSESNCADKALKECLPDKCCGLSGITTRNIKSIKCVR